VMTPRSSCPGGELDSSPGRGKPPDHCKIKTILARLTLNNRAEVHHRLFQQAFPSFFLTGLLGGRQPSTARASRPSTVNMTVTPEYVETLLLFMYVTSSR